MRVNLQTGVWTGAVGLILTGAGAVIVATPAQATLVQVGYLGMALGVGLLIYGLRINGIPWWKRQPGRPRFTALYWPPNYEDGDEVAGVAWRQGYSHIRMTLQNPTGYDYSNFDVIVSMDQPIIEARARAEFGEVQIGPPAAQHTSMVIKGHDTEGKPVQMFVDMGGSNGFTICPSYRIRSALVPRGTKIIADFFTVSDVGGERLFASEPEPPKVIVVQAQYEVLGISKTVNARINAPMQG